MQVLVYGNVFICGRGTWLQAALIFTQINTEFKIEFFFNLGNFVLSSLGHQF